MGHFIVHDFYRFYEQAAYAKLLLSVWNNTLAYFGGIRSVIVIPRYSVKGQRNHGTLPHVHCVQILLPMISRVPGLSEKQMKIFGIIAPRLGQKKKSPATQHGRSNPNSMMPRPDKSRLGLGHRQGPLNLAAPGLRRGKVETPSSFA